MEQFEQSPWARPIDWSHSGVFLIMFIVVVSICFAYFGNAIIVTFKKLQSKSNVVAMKYGVVNIELYGQAQDQLTEALKQRGATVLPVSLYTGVSTYKCLGTTLTQNGKVIYTGECGRDGFPEVYRTWTSPSPEVIAHEFIAYVAWAPTREMTKKL
jgi:hypothetical protein